MNIPNQSNDNHIFFRFAMFKIGRGTVSDASGYTFFLIYTNLFQILWNNRYWSITEVHNDTTLLGYEINNATIRFSPQSFSL